MLSAYHRRLTGEDVGVRRACARAWSVWEGRTSCLLPNEELIARMNGDAFALACARIECHYFMNKGFLRSDGQLLEDEGKLANIPGVNVQGRYDIVCPPESAWSLNRAWPQAELHLVRDAGHSAFEPGNIDALVRATDKFRST